MTSISIAVAVAILTFGSGLFGLYLQKRLPQTHLSGGSKDMILAVIGLLTLLLALVLGTLVGNTYAFFAMQKSELETMASRALLVDQALVEYGPEAKPARNLMKQALTQATTFSGGARTPTLRNSRSRSLSTAGSPSRTRSARSSLRRRLRRMHSPRPKPISR